MPDSLEEIVLLERIDLIARLTTGSESQNRDREIALVWIAELVKEVRAEAIQVKDKNTAFV
ncbi:hypothetical protein ACOMCW_004352 [Yersinia enterocolitica]|uniref:Uncharacterized protein n=2 Tax=Yersinia TaxID=629 RepID=A0ABM6BKT3_YERET|nr:hypothetical protein [Yersinia entomophaga]EKN6250603.1 hypothetical protein [Yersinia enterocolitica]ANI30182.1 hypothetical protein PL78_10150 [Yersinia entomophaga]EKN6280529.1 hypothetical protein [Yersinia enterocolitica]OWF89348.1 hypothetical protein B4914_03250 [Yersinia entomophaga]HEN3344417.1 hypothetical protein [Yersinia enterocolitica]